MYRADLFRPLSGSRVARNNSEHARPDLNSTLAGAHEDAASSAGCRHEESGDGCEHKSLSYCIRKRRNGVQLLATGLVVNWEGCELQTNTSKCLWELSRSIAEEGG